MKDHDVPPPLNDANLSWPSPAEVATMLRAEMRQLPKGSSPRRQQLGQALEQVEVWRAHQTPPTPAEYDAFIRAVRTVTRTARARERGRGARRRTVKTGSADNSGGEEPEPPGDAGRRFCIGCGRDISHKRADARTCGAKCRQRAHQHADPLRYVVDADAYLNLPRWELAALRDRVTDGCRCNGHHILNPDDGTCVKCGHAHRSGVAPYYVLLWQRDDAGRAYLKATSAERQHPRPLEEAVR